MNQMGLGSIIKWEIMWNSSIKKVELFTEETAFKLYLQVNWQIKVMYMLLELCFLSFFQEESLWKNLNRLNANLLSHGYELFDQINIHLFWRRVSTLKQQFVASQYSHWNWLETQERIDERRTIYFISFSSINIKYYIENIH